MITTTQNLRRFLKALRNSPPPPKKKKMGEGGSLTMYLHCTHYVLTVSTVRLIQSESDERKKY